MTDAQGLILAQELADTANLVVHMLNDLTLPLTDQQTQALQNYAIQLGKESRQIAIAGALSALNAAQADFNSMTQATTAANAAVTQLKTSAAKLNSILDIVGKAVSFGAALVAGPVGTALAAAGALAGSAATAMT